MCAVACFGWSRKKSEKGTPKKIDGFSSGQDMHLLSQNLDNFRVVMLGWGWPFCLVSPQMLEKLKAQKLTMLNKGAKLPSQKQQSFGTDSASEPIANLMWQKSLKNLLHPTALLQPTHQCALGSVSQRSWSTSNGLAEFPSQVRPGYHISTTPLRPAAQELRTRWTCSWFRHNPQPPPAKSAQSSTGVTEDPTEQKGTPSSWDRHHRYLTSKRSMADGREKWGKIG